MQLSYDVGVDGLTLSSKPSTVITLDDLKPYSSNKFSLETFDVIVCDCYSIINPSSTVCVSITDPGMTLKHRDLTI